MLEREGAYAGQRIAVPLASSSDGSKNSRLRKSRMKGLAITKTTTESLAAVLEAGTGAHQAESTGSELRGPGETGRRGARQGRLEAAVGLIRRLQRQGTEL